MTRAAMRFEFADLLGEVIGSPGAASPFSVDRWLNIYTDELAQCADAVESTLTADVVAGQADYCDPDWSSTGTNPLIYKPKSIRWLDSAGKWNLLETITIQELDLRYPLWMNDTNGSPRFAVMQGANVVTLYPTPDTSTSAALKFIGYSKPANSWASNTAECPLPGGDSIHMGPVFAACKLRCIQFPTPENTARVASLESSWQKVKGRLQREVRMHSAATSHADQHGNKPGIFQVYY